MKKERFKLSSSGKVAAWMALAFVTLNSAAAGIVADGGPNGPGVSQVNGTDIVNITAPNSNGLSHNQYLDFNVDNQGAVFNNALTAGQSQLAGMLEANKNLNGQAAGVILNEVVSRNPSLLLGQQEVFGMAADLILANPNGISCQGCGFINTNNAGLIVGNPLIENGMISAYSTLDNTNSLTIGNNGITTGKVLDLVAPAINADGEIRAAALNVITGNNTVSADMQTISAGKNAVPLDSYYLGGMRAGKIRLVNTAQGSGVKLAGNIDAVNGFDAQSQGALKLTGAQVTGGDIRLSGDTLRTEGQLRNEHQRTEDKRSGQSVTGETRQGRYTRTSLDGKNITLVAQQEARLTGTDLHGIEIAVQAGTITLGSDQVAQSDTRTTNQWKMSWENNETRKDESIRQETSNLRSDGDIRLAATTGDITLKGATLAAGTHLSADAKGDIRLESVTNSRTQTVSGNKRNETAKLLSGTHGDVTSKEQLVKTELTAGGNLGLNAGHDIRTQAAQVHAGQDLIINTGNNLTIGTQTTTQHQGHTENITSWGGIGGGSRENRATTEETAHGSDVTAGGKLWLSGGNGVTVTGSKVKGTQDSLAQTGQGALVIENGISRTAKHIDNRDGGAFNITRSTLRENSEDTRVERSELKSEADLRLAGKNDITIAGSLIESAGTLKIDTLGDINVRAAQAQKQSDKTETTLKISGYAKEDEDKQYRAGLDINHTRDTQKQDSVTQQGSELKGSSVSVTAGNDLTLTGSSLTTTQGDAALSAENITLNAADNRETRTQQKGESHGGIYLTGGMDKLGGGLSGGHTETGKTQEQHQAVTSGTQVQGNLTLTAGKTLSQEGASHTVGGAYTETAQNSAHRAAHNSDRTTETRKGGEGSLGVSLDYSKVSRPLAKAGENIAEGNIAGVADSTAATGLPDIGVDLSGKGENRQTISENTQAKTTSVNAGSVAVNATDRVLDEGTQYRADNGGIAISAGDYQSAAAADTHHQSESVTEGKGSLRVATSTGQDVAISAEGSGGHRLATESSSKAVPGSLSAKGDITVQAGRDAALQGDTLRSEEGLVSVRAGDNLTLDQAGDTHSKTVSGYDAGAKVNVESLNLKNAGGGLSGGREVYNESGTTAKTGVIEGKTGVVLQAGNDLTANGTDVSSDGDVTVKGGHNTLLNSAESTNTISGHQWHGDVQASGGKTETGSKLGGGAEFSISKQSENVTDQRGGSLRSGGTASVSADGMRDDALYLKGTQIDAQNTALTARDGGIVIESAQKTTDKANWNAGGNLNIGTSRSTENPETGSRHNISAGLKGGIDNQQTVTQKNALTDSGNLTLNSRNDTRIQGGKLTADTVSGRVGGDLIVESRTNTESVLKADADLSAAHTNDEGSSTTSKLANAGTPKFADDIKAGLENGLDKAADSVRENAGAGAGTVADKVKSGLTSPSGMNGNVKASFETRSVEQVGQQSGLTAREQGKLRTGGSTILTGAVLDGLPDNGNTEMRSVAVKETGTRIHGELPLNAGQAVSAVKDGIVNGKSPVGISVTNDHSSVNSKVK